MLTNRVLQVAPPEIELGTPAADTLQRTLSGDGSRYAPARCLDLPMPFALIGLRGVCRSTRALNVTMGSPARTTARTPRVIDA